VYWLWHALILRCPCAAAAVPKQTALIAGLVLACLIITIKAMLEEEDGNHALEDEEDLTAIPLVAFVTVFWFVWSCMVVNETKSYADPTATDIVFGNFDSVLNRLFHAFLDPLLPPHMRRVMFFAKCPVRTGCWVALANFPMLCQNWGFRRCVLPDANILSCKCRPLRSWLGPAAELTALLTSMWPLPIADGCGHLLLLTSANANSVVPPPLAHTMVWSCVCGGGGGEGVGTVRV